MPPYRLPRRLLYGALQRGQRSVGGQKKRFSIHVKDTLKKCCIPPNRLEDLASDRESWRDTCKQGLPLPSATTTLLMLKIDVLADKQRLYPHPVLPVTTVTEFVRQTLGFAAIFEATLIRLLLAQRPRRSRRTTSRQGKMCPAGMASGSYSHVISVEEFDLHLTGDIHTMM